MAFDSDERLLLKVKLLAGLPMSRQNRCEKLVNDGESAHTNRDQKISFK